MRLPTMIALMAPLGLVPALAQPAPQLDQAWARATTASAQTAAAYLVVRSTTADQITGISTPVAGMAALHRSQEVGGVMEMRPVDNLAVVPGEALKLSPGGYHVMLMGLKHQLKPGDHFPLTVTFAHAGPVTTDVAVGKAGASGPAAP